MLLAGFLIKTLKLTCDECIRDLIGDKHTSDHQYHARQNSLLCQKDRGGLVKPAGHVLELCSITEKSIRLIINGNSRNMNINTQTMMKVTCQATTVTFNRHLHRSFSCACHAASLIRHIIRRYAALRLHYVTVCKKVETE